MDNKENNQDDLVISSKGEMLTKDESDSRQIEVKQEPEPEEQQTEAAVSADSTTNQQPTGLTPPVMPSPPEPTASESEKSALGQQRAPTNTPTNEQNEENVSSKTPQEQPEIKDNSGVSDEDFAKHHSNHERSSAPAKHPTRNNKKVLAGVIVFGAILLCALAVYVYLSTQENVSEVESDQTNQQQSSTIDDNDVSPSDGAENETPINDSGSIEPIGGGLNESQPSDDAQFERTDDTESVINPVQ